jgi:uncharacterized membrane protein
MAVAARRTRVTLRLPSPKALVWVAMAAFAAEFISLSLLRHRAYNTGRFDLGNIVQAIWTTTQGDFLQQTNLHGEQISRLGSHFEPILAVFAPLWMIWPSPDMLLTVQAIALALGALPVFWLARKHLRSERVALGLALVYLIYPPLQWLALDEFHPGALACPLLLYAFWYLDEDRLVPFAIFAVLACMTREEMPLVVAGMGVWYALTRKKWAFGLGVAAAGLALTAVIVTFVTPHFRHGAPLSFYGRYKDIGGSPSEAVRMIFTHPLHVLQIAFDHRGIRYLFDLLVPLAGICLLAPLALIPAAPLLAINLLSSAFGQTSIHFHYTAGEIPILIAATVFGAAWLARRGARVALTITTIILIEVLISNYALGPLPMWRHLPGGEKLGADRSDVTAHDHVADEALALIPGNAVVSATNNFGAHLSARQRFLSFPALDDATWVAYDGKHPSFADRLVTGEQARNQLLLLKHSPEWKRVFARDRIYVFRRKSQS